MGTNNNRIKIGLIGGGNIGGTLALVASLKQLCKEIVILDRTIGIAKGKALDIEQTIAVNGIDCNISGTDSYEDLSNSNVIIITAGVPRQPGMSRDDLLAVNKEVMDKAAEGVKKYCPDAFVIVVTNPLDAMVYQFQKSSGLPTNKVVGMGGVLDSGRFKLFLSKKLGISTKDITTFVLGGHGDTMVPLTRYTTVCGMPMADIIKMGRITQTELDQIVQRTRDGGAEIVALLQKGSAFCAPAISALEMAEAYLLDKRRILPCAAYLNGQYGINGMYVGVPCIIGKNGVEDIIELELTKPEQDMLNTSINAVKALLAAL